MKELSNKERSNLPFRLRESSFRFYEPYISQAVANLPNATTFDFPKNLSAETFVHRFRDAIASWLTYRWHHGEQEEWTEENLLSLTVSNRTTHALVGTKDAIKQHDQVGGFVPVIADATPFEITAFLNADTIDVLAKLAENGVLNRPVKFYPYLTTIVCILKYDIDLEPLADGSYIIT